MSPLPVLRIISGAERDAVASFEFFESPFCEILKDLHFCDNERSPDQTATFFHENYITFLHDTERSASHFTEGTLNDFLSFQDEIKKGRNKNGEVLFLLFFHT